MVSKTRSTNPIAASILAALIAPALFAQATFPTTTLKTALTGWPAAQQPQLNVFLTSTAAVVPGINPISGSLGDPFGHTNVILMVDTEAMCVNGPVNPNGSVPVQRGCQGTQVFGHSVGTTVWVGYPSYYALSIPQGPCNKPTLQVLPTIYIENATVYDCVLSRWTAIGASSRVHMATGTPVWHTSVPKGSWWNRFYRWVFRKR